MKSKVETLKMSYGVPSEELDRIVWCIKKNKKISDIILFGSRAKGNFQAGSDIDIDVVGNGLTLDYLLHIKIEIEDIELPYKIDIIDYGKIENNELISHIKRVGKHLH